MRKLPTLMTLLAAAVGAMASLSSNTISVAGTCRPAASTIVQANAYPEHPLSPLASLAHFDTIFLGEVAVPAKPCSLGTCAGVKLISSIKGSPGSTVLLRLGAPGDLPCGASSFAAKGQRWLVFANQGTSPGGQRYAAVSDDGPSYMTDKLPDFASLEHRYRMRRAAIDQALDAQAR